MTSTQASVQKIVSAFRYALMTLHSKMDYPSYKTIKLTLEVSYSPDKSAFEITFAEAYSNNVKGVDLAAVMSEAYRRLGYEHQAEASIASSMLQITQVD